MNVVAEDIWLCQDCLMVAVNGDYTGLDYHYGEHEAEERRRQIDAGLAELPNLVPDYNEDEDEWRCECGHTAAESDCPVVPDPDGEGGQLFSCGKCGSIELTHRDSGYRGFAPFACDCCSTTLAGARYRFAQLG